MSEFANNSVKYHSNSKTLDTGFNYEFSYRKFILYSVLLVIITLHPTVIFVLYVLLCAYALIGKEQAIEALAYSVIVKYLNPALVAFPPYFGLLSWLVIFMGSLSLLWRSRLQNIEVIVPLLLFYLTIMCLSFWSSNQLISVMKATSFFVVVASLLLGCSSMTPEKLKETLNLLFNIALFVLILSIPFYFIHSIGFHRNGSGFQGILNHPQSFGIFWVPFVCWFVYETFFVGKQKPVKRNFLLVILMIVAMALSKSRTALLATSLSILVTFPFLFVINKNSKKVEKSKAIITAIFSFWIVVTIFAATETPMRYVNNLIHKGKSERSVTESFHHSRGRLIETQISNFKKEPWVGNGFGVYASGQFPSGVKYFMGLPISASVEKGIIFTSILEETGIIGTTFFIIFIVSILYPIIVYAKIPFLSMIIACIAVNFGEAILFSVNGNGIWYWLLIGIVMAMNLRKKSLYVHGHYHDIS